LGFDAHVSTPFVFTYTGQALPNPKVTKEMSKESESLMNCVEEMMAAAVCVKAARAAFIELQSASTDLEAAFILKTRIDAALAEGLLLMLTAPITVCAIAKKLSGNIPH
jgi:hypothetical protein